MKILKSALPFFMTLVFLAVVPALARAEAKFFESLPDVPVMDGLKEMSEFDISYDKPQGRITESLATIEGDTSDQEITSFYAATMPQLGWRRISDRAYERGDEHLEFKIDSEGGHRFLRVMVRPR